MVQKVSQFSTNIAMNGPKLIHRWRYEW